MDHNNQNQENQINRMNQPGNNISPDNSQPGSDAAQQNNTQPGNPYMQNNTYQQTPFYASGSTPPAPKKRKVWPIVAGIAGVMAAAAAGIIILTAFFFLRKPSLINCIKQLDRQFSTETLGTTALEQKLDRQHMAERIAKKGESLDLSLTLSDTDEENLALAKGVTAGISYQTDVKNHCRSLGLNVSYGLGRTKLLDADASLYIDSNHIAVASDEFLAGNQLALSKTELLNQLDYDLDSAERKYLDSVFDQQNSQVYEDMNDFSAFASDRLPSALVSFAQDWDIRENGSRQTISIGSEDYTAYAYEVSVSERAMKHFLEDYCEYLADYDYADNEFFKSAFSSTLLSDPEDMEDTIKEELRSIPEQLDEDSRNSLDLTVYVSRNGKLLGADMEIGEAADSLAVELRFGGKKPGQDIYFDCSGDLDGNHMYYSFSSTRKTNNNVETSQMMFTCSIDDMVIDVNSRNEYHTKENSFTSTTRVGFSLDDESAEAELICNGTFTNIDKGSGCSISFDKIALNINAAEVPFSTLELSGTLSIGVLEDSIEKPDGKEYDILNLSENDITALAKYLKQSKTLSYVLGSITEDDLKEYLKDALEDIM